MQMLTNIAPLGGLLKLRSGSRSADVSSFVFKLTCRYTSAILVALSFLISSSNWLRHLPTDTFHFISVHLSFLSKDSD